MLSEFRKKKVKRIFDFYDANGNNCIDMGDIDGIANSFAKEFNWPIGGETDTHFRQVFKTLWKNLITAADANQDGVVSLEEFYNHYNIAIADDSAFYKYIKPFFDGIFPIVDADGDGVLSKDDYMRFFRSFRNSQEEAERAFKVMDLNGDGVISHIELYVMFHGFHMSEDPKHISRIFFGQMD